MPEDIVSAKRERSAPENDSELGRSRRDAGSNMSGRPRLRVVSLELLYARAASAATQEKLSSIVLTCRRPGGGSRERGAVARGKSLKFEIQA